MFQMRDRAYQTWQTAQSTLTKKKEAEMKFKVAGKSDKLAQVQAEIQEVGRQDRVGRARVGQMWHTLLGCTRSACIICCVCS